MSTALAERPAGGALATPRAHQMQTALQEQTEIRSLLKSYIARHMLKDSDFGVIPGTPKPTLLQPGAEKLAELFRCTPEFTCTQRVEDWDRDLFHYEYACKLMQRDTQTCISEGVGSCNSREGRYRWRNANRKCPRCGKEAIIKGKDEYGGGWICFKKKDGCGAKFADDAEEITGQAAGRVENDDVASVVNTILKMAKKRAHVDAAIALARRYGFTFTQDIEDLPADSTHNPDEALERGRSAAANGTAALQAWWKNLPVADQKRLKSSLDTELKPTAASADQPDEFSEAKVQTSAPPPSTNGTAGSPPPQSNAGETYDAEPPPSDATQAKVEKVMAALHDVKQQWSDPNCKARLSAVIGRTIGPDAAIGELTDAEAEKVVAYCAEHKAKIANRKKKDDKSTAKPNPDKPPQTPEQQAESAKAVEQAGANWPAKVIARETVLQILAQCDRLGLTWPQARGKFWVALGVPAADAISGVDSLSQQQGDLLLGILRMQPAAAAKGAAA